MLGLLTDFDKQTNCDSGVVFSKKAASLVQCAFKTFVALGSQADHSGLAGRMESCLEKLDVTYMYNAHIILYIIIAHLPDTFGSSLRSRLQFQRSEPSCLRRQSSSRPETRSKHQPCSGTGCPLQYKRYLK